MKKKSVPSLSSAGAERMTKELQICASQMQPSTSPHNPSLLVSPVPDTSNLPAELNAIAQSLGSTTVVEPPSVILFPIEE